MAKLLNLKCRKCDHKWQEPLETSIDGIKCPKDKSKNDQIEVMSIVIPEET